MVGKTRDTACNSNRVARGRGSRAIQVAANRCIVVPTSQRAAALRLDHARQQLRTGHAVWASPDISTWDAWLMQQWQRAVTQHDPRIADRQLLTRSQERVLWEQALENLPQTGDVAAMRLHAPALMQAATRAVQSGIDPGRMAMSDEERLLASALAEMKRQLQQSKLISLTLATADDLTFLADAAPPLIAGQQALTPLQTALGQRFWPDADLLQHLPESAAAQIESLHADDRRTELAACANWCLQLLREDGSRRLLVVSAYSDDSLRIQGDQLWRQLVSNTTADASVAIDPQLLSIEGGQSLSQHRLIADALTALQLGTTGIESDDLSRVLSSPYFAFAATTERLQLLLLLLLQDKRRAHWTHAQLQLALTASKVAANPASVHLLELLRSARALHQDSPAQGSAAWARDFSAWLDAMAFGTRGPVDTEDAQRMARWNDLLDEFSTLDSVLGPLRCLPALLRLQGLASRLVHEAAGADAAITLTDFRGDPCAAYDGIWVMGLSESRWPEPPRPNSFLALTEQCRTAWPEANVTLRLQQARWAQSRWQQRSSRLVMSFAAQEGDVHHRPSALFAVAGATRHLAQASSDVTHVCRLGPVEIDAQMPALQPNADKPALPSGSRSLDLQQQCPFRAQTEMRLGALALSDATDGVDSLLRGTLLHAALEQLWKTLGDSQQLAALDDGRREALLESCLQQALHRCKDAALLNERVLQRESRRSLGQLRRLLQMEALRPAFRVTQAERELSLTAGQRQLNLRIDRIDECTDGSRIVIDYKSGRPDKIRLDQTPASPLQLAIYVCALRQQGERVDGSTLLSLHRTQMGYYGVATETAASNFLTPLPDWDQQTKRWQQEVLDLLEDFVAGRADVSPQPNACQYCHLAGLCRKETA
jgi:ATP-dependent helicase/nuclease subunit B